LTLCVDDKGGKHIIDVKTTTSTQQSVSCKIGKELARSSHHIQEALKLGFKVLIPIIKLDKDWKIEIDLVEITQ